MSKPELREKQIEQLAYYIANPKCLDTSYPGTGKTPPCCVYSYWHWDRNEKKTLWTMPKSLLNKNRLEMLRFTEFKDSDVVILETDHAPMTKKWTGPTIERIRTLRGFKVKFKGVETDTVALREEAGETIRFVTIDGEKWSFPFEKNTKPIHVPTKASAPNIGSYRVIEPILGPDDKPVKMKLEVKEIAKDLIKLNADAKVFITTFAFASNHWVRLLEAIPDLDLLLSDELHMPGGYSTPSSKATESFYWLNKKMSRFVGMTGTLINGRLDSAYPSISVIEPRYYGSFQGFMYEHAAVVDDYNRVQVWKNHDKLQQILQRHSIQRTFEEVYGKEPVAFFTQYADIGEKVKESYDKFHAQALLELEDGRVLDGTMPGVAFVRARQLLAHPETMLNGIPEWTGKDERIELILSEGKKTLIYAALVPEQERILRLCRSLGLRAELINGNVSGKERTAIDQLAQEGKLDVIVASGPTAAVGWNWEMFDIVVFASINFLDTDIFQAYRRASRGTRTTVLRVYFLRYRNSIDDRQYQIVKVKSQTANKVDSTRQVLEFEEAE